MRNPMPDRNHCQSEVCKGIAGRRTAKVRRNENANRWCRGGELNSLRRPFQGRALPVSYPGISVDERLYGCGEQEARVLKLVWWARFRYAVLSRVDAV